MITGYNTDVEYEGVVYHVQTEDKGIETPLVLSLVYSGGAILASKRSSYQDLIAAGFDEGQLIERLNRQHRLICAAIHAGRLAELKKLGGSPKPVAKPEQITGEDQLAEQPPAPEHLSASEVLADSVTSETVEAPQASETSSQKEVADEAAAAQPLPRRRAQASPYTVYDSRRSSPLGEIPDIEEGLHISLEGEKNFRGGDEVELRVLVTHVTRESEAPLSAAVSVKILGTSFRPVILALKTDRQGCVAISTRIPSFKSGRAAIVIRATAADLSTETRRVIHPG